VEQDQQRLPLSYFVDALAVPQGWDQRPGAYLAFGVREQGRHIDLVPPTRPRGQQTVVIGLLPQNIKERRWCERDPPAGGRKDRVDEHDGHDRPLRRQLGNVRAGVAVWHENDIPVYGQRREEGGEDVPSPQHGLGHPADGGLPALVGKDTGDWAPHRRSQHRAGQKKTNDGAIV
jgi:hypothetical protein